MTIIPKKRSHRCSSLSYQFKIEDPSNTNTNNNNTYNYISISSTEITQKIK